MVRTQLTITKDNSRDKTRPLDSLLDHFVEALPVLRRSALSTGKLEQSVSNGLVVKLSQKMQEKQWSVSVHIPRLPGLRRHSVKADILCSTQEQTQRTQRSSSKACRQTTPHCSRAAQSKPASDSEGSLLFALFHCLSETGSY